MSRPAELGDQLRVACVHCQANATVTDGDADMVLICGVCGHEAAGVLVPRQRGYADLASNRPLPPPDHRTMPGDKQRGFAD